MLTGLQGGMVTGGVDIPVQLPAQWVSRSQSHIVVTINYRVNIMGFPNAAALETQNLGLRDQRAAVEWVQANIAAFGGDPAAITLWGQSAGSRSADFYSFAWHDDPIARGFFMQSGTVLSSKVIFDSAGTNFTFVARNLGCDHPKNKTAELACMRQVPVSEIENFVGQYQDNSTTVNPRQPAIAFTPIVDEDVVFSNYTERYQAGQVAKRPVILSNTANEYSSLAPYPVNNLTAGPNPQAVLKGTLNTVCGISNSSLYRNELDISVYRYVYGGNFSNINPLWWMGAYHASDLAMMFGTYGIRAGASSQLEIETSAAMQDHVLAFVKDPVNGPRTVGWMPYDHRDNGGQMLLFGADGKAVQPVNGTAVEGVCYGVGQYDSMP
jgi:acetylcholinesterase